MAGATLTGPMQAGRSNPGRARAGGSQLPVGGQLGAMIAHRENQPSNLGEPGKLVTLAPRTGSLHGATVVSTGHRRAH